MSVSFENKETNRGVLTSLSLKTKSNQDWTVSSTQWRNLLMFQVSVKVTFHVLSSTKFGEESLYQDVMNALFQTLMKQRCKRSWSWSRCSTKSDVTSMEKVKTGYHRWSCYKTWSKIGWLQNLGSISWCRKEVTDADVEERIERERNKHGWSWLSKKLLLKTATLLLSTSLVLSTVLNLTVEKVKTSHLDLVQVNSSLVSKTNWWSLSWRNCWCYRNIPRRLQTEDLAGKEAKFVTTIHEVKLKKFQLLTMSLQRHRRRSWNTCWIEEKYRKELAAAKEEAYKDAVEGAAIDKAVENAAEIVELPEEMIHEEVHRSVNWIPWKLATSRHQPWHVLPNHWNYSRRPYKQYEGEAESRTKTNLVIEAVAKAEGFDASEEEIQKKSSNWQQTTTWKLQ